MFPVTRRSVAASPLLGAFDRELGRWLNGLEDTGEAMSATYPVDIHEDDTHYTIEAELPGFTRDQVSINLENNVLTIEAQRQPTEKKEGGQTHVNERRYTQVTRSFRVPRSVDENNVEAKLADGVLHLTLHKKEEVRPRKIEVK